MADQGSIASLKAAIQAVLNNSVPDESIEPDDHNELLENLLDTIGGLSKILREDNTTGGYSITISNGDLLTLAQGSFSGDIDRAVLTANRTWTFQDADGVIAFLSDIPAVITNHSGLTLDDGTNPHGTTKTDVGLSNVPNVDATLRSNHTGTQTASTISDFDTEVSNNVDVAANTAKVSNVTTDLSEGVTTNTTVEIVSSDGTNATLQEASTSRAGVMSKAKFDEIVANTAKVSNVTTDLSIANKTGNTLDVASSDGTDATVPAATITEAGLMTAADKVKLDGISDTDDQNASEVPYSNTTSGLTATDVQAAIDEVEGRVDTNDAKVSNVTTDLGVGNNTATNIDVTSSDGTDATLPPATISLAGLMTGADKTKLDGVATNANNYVHPNHTGEVTSTGDGATVVAPTAISNKTVLGSLAGTEEFLINDGGVLKKVLASNVGGTDGNGIYDIPNGGSGTVPTSAEATLTDTLTFKTGLNGKIEFTNSSIEIFRELNGNSFFKVIDSGEASTLLLNSDGDRKVSLSTVSGGQNVLYNPTTIGYENPILGSTLALRSTAGAKLRGYHSDLTKPTFEIGAIGAYGERGELKLWHTGSGPNGETFVKLTSITDVGSSNYLYNKTGIGFYNLTEGSVNAALHIRAAFTGNAFLIQNSALNTDFVKVLTGNGYMGLGVDPTSKLHVGGNTQIDGTTYLNGKLGVGEPNPVATLQQRSPLGIDDTTTNFSFRQANNVELFKLSNGGLLTLNGKFDLNGLLESNNNFEQTRTNLTNKKTTGSATGLISDEYYNDAGICGQLIVAGSTYNGGANDLFEDSFAIRAQNSASKMVLGSRTGDIYFVNGSNLSSANTNMKVTSSGVIIGAGVGTITPTATLHVNGSTLLDGNLGVFGTTPIAQPTTALIAPSPVAVGGVNVQTNDTFEGYTLSQVVKALRNLGILA